MALCWREASQEKRYWPLWRGDRRDWHFKGLCSSPVPLSDELFVCVHTQLSCVCSSVWTEIDLNVRLSLRLTGLKIALLDRVIPYILCQSWPLLLELKWCSECCCCSVCACKPYFEWYGSYSIISRLVDRFKFRLSWHVAWRSPFIKPTEKISRNRIPLDIYITHFPCCPLRRKLKFTSDINVMMPLVQIDSVSPAHSYAALAVCSTAMRCKVTLLLPTAYFSQYVKGTKGHRGLSSLGF